MSVNFQGERYIETPREQGFTGTTKGSSSQTKEMFDTTCKTISPNGANFDLVLCVTRSGDVQSTIDTDSKVAVKTSTYHAYSEGWACRHGFRKAFRSTGGVKFAPRQFAGPTLYMNTNETSSEIKDMNDFV